MSELKRIKNFCGECCTTTNHFVIGARISSSHPDEYPESYKFMLVQCCGCESYSYRTEYQDHTSSYIDDDGEWVENIDITLFPPFLKREDNIRYLGYLPETVKRVYSESVKAFKNDCFLLTGMAFRSVIEAICIEEKVSGRNLEVKIDNLLKGRYITEKEANRLHSIRFLGNDSVHEMTTPKEQQLYIVLEIINNLLNNLYLIDKKIGGQLDTVIEKYSHFEDLIEEKLLKLKHGDEFPIAYILGKDFRRVVKNITSFESEFITRIMAGAFDKCGVGKKDKYSSFKEKQQYFTVISAK